MVVVRLREPTVDVLIHDKKGPNPVLRQEAQRLFVKTALSRGRVVSKELGRHGIARMDGR